MNVDNNLIGQIVKALSNQNGGSNDLNKFYGTVATVDGRKCVKLDGSDAYTAVVEGTEVMDGDRVLVGIENHQAVVYANITSPASARTATNFMDFGEEGLVIGQVTRPGGAPQSVVIGSLGDGEEGVYLRIGNTAIAKFISDEYGEPKIVFGPFERTSTDERSSVLDSFGLCVYKNFSEWGYDDAVRIGANYIAINPEGSNPIELAQGKVTASYGCNAKIVYVDKTVSNISVTHGSTTPGTTSVTIPTGYTPCGLIAYQIKEHLNTCCFTQVDIDTDGTINYRIQNHGTTDWSDVGAYFQVACIWTG